MQELTDYTRALEDRCNAMEQEAYQNYENFDHYPYEQEQQDWIEQEDVSQDQDFQNGDN